MIVRSWTSNLSSTQMSRTHPCANSSWVELILAPTRVESGSSLLQWTGFPRMSRRIVGTYFQNHGERVHFWTFQHLNWKSYEYQLLTRKTLEVRSLLVVETQTSTFRTQMLLYKGFHVSATSWDTTKQWTKTLRTQLGYPKGWVPIFKIWRKDCIFGVSAYV